MILLTIVVMTLSNVSVYLLLQICSQINYLTRHMHVYYIKTRPVTLIFISISSESRFSSTSQSDTHSEKEGNHADNDGKNTQSESKKKNTNQHMDSVCSVSPISDFN